jgi:hypothetical protein
VADDEGSFRGASAAGESLRMLGLARRKLRLSDLEDSAAVDAD